jgi:hypothetical protein
VLLLAVKLLVLAEPTGPSSTGKAMQETSPMSSLLVVAQ